MAEHVGLVEEGMFRPLGPNRGAESVQLTADGMQVGRDVQPMDVADYEGLVVLVEGDPLDSQWLYDAGVVDQAGRRLSSVLKRMLSNTPDAAQS